MSGFRIGQKIQWKFEANDGSGCPRWLPGTITSITPDRIDITIDPSLEDEETKRAVKKAHAQAHCIKSD